MAKARRILRLQQLILEIVAETIQREVRDPRVGVVSVTRVKLSPDLTAARVYWSALGEEGTIRTTQRGLEDALPMIQRSVASGLRTRVTPRLALQFDDTLAKSARLEEIFHKVHVENRERGLEPDPADGDASDAVSDDEAPRAHPDD